MPHHRPAEFRRRALDLVRSGRTVLEVARTLGISENCLYRWKSCDRINRGLKDGQTSRQTVQLREARKRIRELEEQVKILSKAAAAVEAVAPPKGPVPPRRGTRR
jgi:transposase-like protein